MKKTALWIQALVLVLFLGGFFVLHLALPDRSFSDQENRVLQTLPGFSFSDLAQGKFTQRVEDYVTDQFPFRDDWISLKARTELTAGKDSNNDIFLCGGDTLLETYTAPADEDLAFRMEAVNALADSAGVPVYFALIPSASELWGDLLPAGAPNDSQKATIDAAYALSQARTVDVYDAMQAHRDEPLYYRTDHHWTTLGAYYGYTALAEAMGFEPVPLTDYTETLVTDAFYGSAWSAAGFSWVPPDRISRYVPQGDAVVTNYVSGQAEPGTMYDESKLEFLNKYPYFFGGNTPLLTIDTGNDQAPSLLILRDSYMDSLSPYLLAHFSQIHILDLRYYQTSLKAYLAAHPVDQILVCYNVKNFSQDGNVFLAAS